MPGTPPSSRGVSSDQVILQTLADAKGDVIGASAADTWARLPVGANDTVLTAASGETTGLKWAPPGGSAPITRATYDLSTTNVAAGVATKMPFAFNAGTALLDLTSPTNPEVVTAGTYSFGVRVAIAVTDETGFLTLTVVLDEDDFAAELSTKLTWAATIGTIAAVTLPFYVPTGSPCYARVTHTNGGGANVTGVVQLQRLS